MVNLRQQKLPLRFLILVLIW